MRKNHPQWYDGCFETLNLLRGCKLLVTKCLQFVMSYMKQNKQLKQAIESAQYGLEVVVVVVVEGHDIEVLRTVKVPLNLRIPGTSPL